MSADRHAADAVERVARLAEERLDDSIRKLGVDFIGRYLADCDPVDLTRRPAADLYGAAISHFRLGQTRTVGTPAVAIANPTAGGDGWQSAHTVVMIVTDDMPFLVDSVRMALARHELGIHLTIHPMLYVERNARGEIVDFPARDGRVEAWMLFEIDRCSTEAAAALDVELRRALADVRRAVDDVDLMRARVMEIAESLDEQSESGGIARQLLTWMMRRRFVFLGMARYNLGPDASPDAGPDGRSGGLTDALLDMDESSALGLCRETSIVDPPMVPGTALVAISRTDRRSTVHRPSRMACIAIRRFNSAGEVVAEERILGLFAAAAYRESVTETPLLREKAEEILAHAEFPAESHSGRAVRTALEGFPRDLLMEVGSDELFDAISTIVGINERQMVRVIPIAEPGGRWMSCLVYLPRSRFSGDTAGLVAEAVRVAFGGDRVEQDTSLGGSVLARVHVVVHRADGSMPVVRRADLEARIDALTTSWADRLADEMTAAHGEQRSRELLGTFASAIPADYQAVTDPRIAVADVVELARLTGESFATAIQRRVEDSPGERRFKVYRVGEPITLSSVLPLLENLGLAVVDERPFEFTSPGGGRRWVYDIGVRLPDGVEFTEGRAAELRRTFESLFRGDSDNDGFNRLVLVAGLSGRQVTIVRAYAKYLRQTGFPFSQQAIEGALAKHPNLATLLAELFDARFDPTASAGREAVVVAVRGNMAQCLDAIPSLDEDRIGRAMFGLIEATLRTSAFRPLDATSLEGAVGPFRTSVAFKFDPARIDDLPLPRPMFEIWVYSPRVEGVHLRGGRVARGGLRWSDRREDFRTEVLGLMKAQMVKNAVIVPVGAKGGFVMKRPPTDPEALRAEVVESYRIFVSGLLDVTDNIVGGAVVPPPATVRYDGDDTYLVVAADKGTATFSDIANGLSERYGFWLGDAFASGGSVGYDHKAMGITAKGAWESVRRHARVLGKNADADSLTVVGIGDMSGDVFGNGLLSSPRLRLVAAFDHRHIFIDPSPDTATSYAERQRLFVLPRSSWADYDATLISAGGGVFSRSAKVIDLSDQARAVLGVDARALAPTEVISAILKAPVDLLWNGGIGTYVKASTENHADVGDRANDGLRVDGNQLRARIVGEGGNLGFTQRGRVEYALAGGLIYTDAIDNSAGVDCSDHEVNMKILLNHMVAAGDMTVKQRNELLVEMTDEVGQLVLDDNQAQTLALAIARIQAAPMVNVHARYIHQLEVEGWLNRAIEFLPTDKQLADRQAAGAGLTTPEFAVLLAYTKNANIAEIEQTPGMGLDPYFKPELLAYFPRALRTRFPEAILDHPLRSEITLTALVNQMVNLSGITFDHRMTEETGAAIGDVMRAWVAARDIFGLPALWATIEATSAEVTLATQLSLFMEARRMTERSVLWLLRHRRPPLALAETVAAMRPGVRELLESLAPLVRGPLADQTQALAAERIVSGVTPDLAEQSAIWPLMHTAFDLVELSTMHACALTEAAGAYWQLVEVLDVTWLWNAIGSLPRADRWQTHARAALRDDLLSALTDLTSDVLAHGGDAAAWASSQARAVDRAASIFSEIRRVGTFDLTTLSVALRQLRNLVLSTTATQTSS